MNIKLTANARGAFDIGINSISNNSSITLEYDKIYNSEDDVIKVNQWSRIINLINETQIIVSVDMVDLIPAEAINLLQMLVNEPRLFAVRYLNPEGNGSTSISSSIDINNDGVITRSEILDANEDSINDIEDIVAIVNNNVQD